MDSFVVVIGFFCVGPAIIFMIGFWVGRWSARVRIVRRDALELDKRYAAPQPDQPPAPGRLKRPSSANR